MKNSVIKKLMAYLLVGAMVISTPVAASAAESIADVYSKTDENGGTKSSSGTQSSSSTNTTIIANNEINVLGIEFNTTALDLVKGDKATVQARVVFSDYDPSGEEMEWVTAQEKDLIENRLHWEIDDTSVAQFPKEQSKDYSKRVIEAKASGQTYVWAWLDMNLNGEFDYEDYSAYADINVTDYATAVTIKDVPTFYWKHTYDLNDYTWLTVDGKEVNASEANEDVTYYLTGDAKDLKNLTINDLGQLTVKQLPKSETPVVLYATTEKCKSKGVTLTLDQGVAATGLEIVKDSSKYVTKFDANKKASATIELDPGSTKDVVAGDTYRDNTGLEVKMTAGDTDPASITDEVTWKSSNVKVADVTNKTGETNTVVINGVGTAKITATTTSNKKVTYTVKVTATPTGIDLYVDNTMYTGQSRQAYAYVQTGNMYITNKIKPKFTIEKVNNKADKNAKVDGKGVVKAANILDTLNTTGEMTADVTVTASYKVTVNGVKCEDSDSATITITQSNISGIDVVNATTGYAAYTDNERHNAKPATAEKVYVGNDYTYVVTDSANDADVTDMVQWSSSNAKLGYVDGSFFRPLAAGKPSIKVSYVTLTEKVKNGKTQYSAKLTTKSIPVQVIQKATSLTLAKNAFVVAPGKKTSVTVSVKTQLPKGSADVITWKVLSANENGESFIDANDSSQFKPSTDKLHKSVKVTIPATAQAGDIVKIGAYADGGAVAYAYIYVTEKTGSLVISNKADGTKDDVFKTGKTKNKVEMTFDEDATTANTLKIYPRIILTDKAKTVVTPGTPADNGKGIVTETVTYSVDKKGASVVKVSADGTITALKPGTAKVTAQTISGKKATLTVVVK